MGWRALGSLCIELHTARHFFKRPKSAIGHKHRDKHAHTRTKLGGGKFFQLACGNMNTAVVPFERRARRIFARTLPEIKAQIFTRYLGDLRKIKVARLM